MSHGQNKPESKWSDMRVIEVIVDDISICNSNDISNAFYVFNYI